MYLEGLGSVISGIYPAPMVGTFHFAGGFFDFEEFLLQSLHEVKALRQGHYQNGARHRVSPVWAVIFTLALLLYPTHTNSSFLVVAFNHGKYLDIYD